MRCWWDKDCRAPITHAEFFYDTIRAFCEEHTPWSGHYEDHGLEDADGRNACARALFALEQREAAALQPGTWTERMLDAGLF